MNKPSIGNFIQSTVTRLALSYLAIIMVMSIGFSFVFYQTSSHELDRQMPPPSVFVRSSGDGNGRGVITVEDSGGYDDVSIGPVAADSHYRSFFQHRIDEGRAELLGKLIILNLIALLLGTMVSYYLARLTLQPIEEALESQNRFVTDASHELRTPLTAILTSNEVALRNTKLKLPEAKETIKSNIEEVKKLKDLTDGLLNLSKQNGSSYKIKPVAVQGLIGASMDSVIKSAQAKNISVDDHSPNIKVLGDKDALTQVMVILLDNAIKYSKEDTTVHIEGHKKDGKGFIAVRDEGQGISAKDLPHVFDRFYRADKARSGSEGYGIGLSIAQKIVDQHDGKIVADSNPGKGAVFTVELPLA